MPDVSGLVGLLPRAELIMLPIPPGCAIDRDLAGGTFPEGDETEPDDGWAVFSGTSAACPQVAGVCALILQACPRLGPAEVRELLTTTARDVTTGTNHPNFGNEAVPGPDNATGARPGRRAEGRPAGEAALQHDARRPRAARPGGRRR